MKKKRRNSLILDLRKLRFRIVKKMDIDDVGNYRGNEIIVFDTNDKIKNTAILIHEFVEAMLVYAAGYTVKQLDKLDEKPRYKRPSKYQRAHRIANRVERVFVEYCGFDWSKHNEEINKVKINF